MEAAHCLAMPFLATAVAYVVWGYREHPATDGKLCYLLILLFSLAFLAAGIIGLFGILIRKAAPVL